MPRSPATTSPSPRVYLASAEAFNCAPADCMMVAAHSNDLAAAAKCGLRTAHIARPNERGPGKGETAPGGPVDLGLSVQVIKVHRIQRRSYELVIVSGDVGLVMPVR